MTQPKGFLIAIGGAEDKGHVKRQKSSLVSFEENGILKSLIKLVSNYHWPRIEVISTASSFPEVIAKDYLAAFRKLGCFDVGHLDIQSREQAESKPVLARLKKANCIFFTGGDQRKLCSILKETTFIDIIKARYLYEPFFIAGSSAGAAAMSHIIITGGSASKAYKKGHVNFCTGFGFLQEAVIDTHFDKRGRLSRLLQAIAQHPNMIGIGLSEDTGIIVERGHVFRAIGSGTAVLIEGRKLSYNNFHMLSKNTPYTLSNVVLHTLSTSN